MIPDLDVEIKKPPNREVFLTVKDYFEPLIPA
ncbi:hypothetical protein ACPR111641_06295 [Acinetobacter pragensis]